VGASVEAPLVPLIGAMYVGDGVVGLGAKGSLLAGKTVAAKGWLPSVDASVAVRPDELSATFWPSARTGSRV
jgi:hypothetical protein